MPDRMFPIMMQVWLYSEMAAWQDTPPLALGCQVVQASRQAAGSKPLVSSSVDTTVPPNMKCEPDRRSAGSKHAEG